MPSRLPAPLEAAMFHVGSAVAEPAAVAFLAGVQHPIISWHHLTPMVAVGLWAALIGAPGLWIVLAVWPAAMATGGMLAHAGLSLPWAGAGLATLALAVGLMVALALRPPVAAAAALTGTYAFLHGQSHGAALVPLASPYAAGVLSGSVFLLLTGVAIGAVAEWPGGRAVARAVGAGFAFAALGLLSAA